MHSGTPTPSQCLTIKLPQGSYSWCGDIYISIYKYTFCIFQASEFAVYTPTHTVVHIGWVQLLAAGTVAVIPTCLLMSPENISSVPVQRASKPDLLSFCPDCEGHCSSVGAF